MNKNFKNEILQLRSEGKSYNAIKRILNCSKSLIAYHCGKGQKEKTNNRQKKYRLKNRLATKVDSFRNGSLYKQGKRKKIKDSVRGFQRKIIGRKKTAKATFSFSDKDVIAKFGVIAECYLSGEKMNLIADVNYSLDHIIPSSKGGDNSFENLGVAHRVVNEMKGSLSVDEFIFWCKKIVEHNGYMIVKK